MRFIFTILILIFTGAYSASAGTCIQNCGGSNKVFSNGNKKTLNLNNPLVNENANYSAHASNANGFKKHGLTISKKGKEPVRTGETSLRFELRRGDCGKNLIGTWNDCNSNRERHELEMAEDGIFDTEKWVSYSIFVPEQTKVFSRIAGSSLIKATSIAQFHQRSIVKGIPSKSSPPFMFNLEPNGITIQNFVINANDNRPLIAAREDVWGQWLDVLVHLYSTSNRDGYFRVYINGGSEPVYAYEGAITSKDQTLYSTIGIYRYGVADGEETPTQIIYFDNWFIEESCEDIKPELGFNCAAIKQTEVEINKTREPMMMGCDGGQICFVKYGRSKEQIINQLSCIFKDASLVSAPSKEQIQTFAETVQGWDDFRMKKGDWYWNGMFNEETLSFHGDAMAKSLNLYIDESENFVCQN